MVRSRCRVTRSRRFDGTLARALCWCAAHTSAATDPNGQSSDAMPHGAWQTMADLVPRRPCPNQYSSSSTNGPARRRKGIGLAGPIPFVQMTGLNWHAVQHFLPTGFAQDFARIPDPVAAYERVTEIAQAADEAGYETLWAPDHLTTIPPSQQIVFEAWSLITGLAVTRPGSGSANW